MILRHLEILEAIAQTGTFTGAARKLYITQSAVSHAVAELEKQTGADLFYRLPKGVALTPCGEMLLDEAKGILTACRDLDRRIPHLEENIPIHVASSITIASFLLPRILSNVRREMPELHISVRVESAQTCLDLLNNGGADAAFWEGTMPRGNFLAIPLGSYSLQAVCAPDFTLPAGPLTLLELVRYPLLLREPGSAIRDTFDNMLAVVGCTAVPVWESVNSFALIKAAEEGLGIAVLPEKLLMDSLALGRLRRISLKNVRMENRMFALVRTEKYLTKSLEKFLDFLKKEEKNR